MPAPKPERDETETGEGDEETLHGLERRGPGVVSGSVPGCSPMWRGVGRRRLDA